MYCTHTTIDNRAKVSSYITDKEPWLRIGDVLLHLTASEAEQVVQALSSTLQEIEINNKGMDNE